MRRFSYMLSVLLCILIVGCPAPQSDTQDKPPWTVIELNTTPQPLDVPYQAVTVNEIARYTPPDNITWPAAIDFRGQTAWKWNETEIGLFAAEIITSEEDDTESRTTQLYKWTLSNDDINTVSVSRTPSGNAWLPVPVPISAQSRRFFNVAGFAFVIGGGESTTRSISMGENEAIGLEIINDIWFYRFNATSPHKISTNSDFSQGFYELAMNHVYAPLERNRANCLVFQDYRDQHIPMPDGVMKITKNYACVNLDNLWVMPLEKAIRDTYGAEFTGFTLFEGIPPNFFFSGVSPFDNSYYIYVSNNSYTIAIPIEGILKDDGQDDIVMPVKVTGYIPAVQYAGTMIVFAEHHNDDDESTLISAIQFETGNIKNITGQPSVIWSSEVPNIFSVATVIPVGENADTARPYTVCLNPLTGELTVFDPLLGSIRHQSIIELAEWHAGDNLASFCVNFDPDPTRPIVFIHDPNANEIIELELQISEPTRGNIVPIEETG